MIKISLLLEILVLGLISMCIALYWAFTHLAQLAIVVTWLCRLFSWVSRGIKFKAVANEIQSRINVSTESIESEVQGVMPHPIKIKWITRGKERAQLEDGEVVVRIRNEFDDARNIATATMLYLGQGLLRSSRPYLDPKLLKALDLTVAWKILGKTEETDLAHYFLSNIFNPVVDREPIIQSDCEKVDDLDSKGVMTRVFMRELRGVGTKASALGEKPTSDIKSETRGFTDFLHTIVTSEKGAIYPLDFIGDKIRVGVLLIASMETLAMSGLRGHKYWFKKKRQMGVDTIYILASGDKNVKLARHLAQWSQSEGFGEIVRTQAFIAPSKLGRSEKAIVISCHSTMVKADTFLDPEEEVHAILVRYIPEIATGGVDVLDVAREIGVTNKVVVRANRENINPVGACIGPNCKYLDEVIKSLGETVWFVEFHDNPETFLLSCLSIPQEKLVSLELKRNSGEAKVVVQDRETAAIAIGSKGVNSKLTGKITGLRIQILTAEQDLAKVKPQSALSPEEILREALIAEIPEFNDGVISIVDMVREPGVQSKVVVRHSNINDKAVSVCVGRNKQHIRTLVEKLGENIWFVERHEDPEVFLLGCLVISRNRVLSVKINDVVRTAQVFVTDTETCAIAIGEQGINARQAAQLTGLRYIKISVT